MFLTNPLVSFIWIKSIWSLRLKLELQSEPVSKWTSTGWKKLRLKNIMNKNKKALLTVIRFTLDCCIDRKAWLKTHEIGVKDGVLSIYSFFRTTKTFLIRETFLNKSRGG